MTKFHSDLFGRDIDVPLPDIERADRAFHVLRVLIMATVFNDTMVREEMLRHIDEGQRALRTPAKGN